MTFAERKAQFQANVHYASDVLRVNLSQGMKPRKAAKAVRNDPRIAKLDPMTIMLIVKVLIMIAQWYFNRKQDPKTVSPPSFLFEVSDDHFRDSESIDDSDDD